MDPNLLIAAGDWIVGDPEELYSVYKQRDLARLLYMGINTNLCVMNTSISEGYFARLGSPPPKPDVYLDEL